jgi:hypothetical protein
VSATCQPVGETSRKFWLYRHCEENLTSVVGRRACEETFASALPSIDPAMYLGYRYEKRIKDEDHAQL